MLLVVSGTTLASVSIKTNPDTKLVAYKLVQDGFKLELIQRLPDQTRAFFMARGFSNKDANNIALSCIFQTIGKNVSSQSTPNPIEVNLKDWKVHFKNKIQNIKMKEVWDKLWVNSAVSKASKIAFKWATFPSYQNFSNSGDYGWGMISFNLPPKAVFDLEVIWKQNKKQHHAWIRSIQCPDDR